jgi:hypothetical protein
MDVPAPLAPARNDGRMKELLIEKKEPQSRHTPAKTIRLRGRVKRIVNIPRGQAAFQCAQAPLLLEDTYETKTVTFGACLEFGFGRLRYSGGR